MGNHSDQIGAQCAQSLVYKQKTYKPSKQKDKLQSRPLNCPVLQCHPMLCLLGLCHLQHTNPSVAGLREASPALAWGTGWHWKT